MASSLPKMTRAMERCNCETVCEVAVGIVENRGPSCYNIDDGVAIRVRCPRCWRLFGRLAQLVRALPSHGRGQRFKSFVAHHSRAIFILAEKRNVNGALWRRVSMFERFEAGARVTGERVLIWRRG